MSMGMTIPLVFQAKAMSIRLVSIAVGLGIAFLSMVIVSFQSSSLSNIEGLKNNEITVIPLPGGAVGPESFSFDGNGGGPYTGVSDGRIIRWVSNQSRWVDFAFTSPERNGCGTGTHGDHSEKEHICGRPLGQSFNYNTGDLYIADAYMGLLVVGPNGGTATPILKQVHGLPLGFTNALDIDHRTGDVYFTDTSTRFPRRNYVSVIISGDNTGRLIKFQPKTNETTVLVDKLRFPNGIALSKCGSFLLFVETTTCTLFKYWLKAPKAGELEVVAQFPGFPDNIKRNGNGEFWVGINSRRGKLLEWIVSNPWIGNALIRVSPVDVTKIHSCLARLFGSKGMGIRLDRYGNVVEIRDSNRAWTWVSEVYERNGSLWIGSVTRSFILKEKIPRSLI